MKRTMVFALLVCSLSFFTMGCETVRTLDAPSDATHIRKPADTTRPVRQEDTIIIERVY